MSLPMMGFREVLYETSVAVADGTRTRRLWDLYGAPEPPPTSEDTEASPVVYRAEMHDSTTSTTRDGSACESCILSEKMMPSRESHSSGCLGWEQNVPSFSVERMASAATTSMALAG